MTETFNIFIEERAEKKLCPHIEYLESKDSKDLVDWASFEKCEEINLSIFPEITNTSVVVLGYFRISKEDSEGYFVKYAVIDSKEHIYLQHKEDCDLIIFMTDHDLEGNPLEERIFKGAIKIDGRIREEFREQSAHDRKVWGGIAQQVLNRPDKGMRVFSLAFLEKKKSTRKPKKKDAGAQPAAAN